MHIVLKLDAILQILPSSPSVNHELPNNIKTKYLKSCVRDGGCTEQERKTHRAHQWIPPPIKSTHASPQI
ncbi:hypothetical protein M8J76_007662 [Diaphorina citri]|nr:hypothetical protein M8J76_007662 [Diaphorina citri]